ncbi:MAG: hypothetical protein HZC28_12780 [Spirochaetes bacterium]|nr:hypothetical protein [Spirochaetota bacterium]
MRRNASIIAGVFWMVMCIPSVSGIAQEPPRAGTFVAGVYADAAAPARKFSRELAAAATRELPSALYITNITADDDTGVDIRADVQRLTYEKLAQCDGITLYDVAFVCVHASEHALTVPADLTNGPVIIYGGPVSMSAILTIESHIQAPLAVITASSYTDALACLASNTGACIIAESIDAFASSFSGGTSIHFSLLKDVLPAEHAGWLMPKHFGYTVQLENAIEKLKRSGDFDAIWYSSFGIAREQYAAMLEKNDPRTHYFRRCLDMAFAGEFENALAELAKAESADNGGGQTKELRILIDSYLQKIATNTDAASAVIVEEMPKTFERPSEVEKLKTKSPDEAAQYEGERYFKVGVYKFNRKEYPEAADCFRKANALSYKPEQSREYLVKAEKAFTENKRAQDEDRMKRFNDIFEKAIRYYTKSSLQEALNAITECLNLFPDNEMAKKYYILISDNITLEGERTIDMSSPYYTYFKNRMAAADDHMLRNTYAEAREIFEEVLALFPNNERARESLITCLLKLDPEKLKTFTRDYIDRGNRALAAGNLRDANMLFSSVKRIAPDHPQIDDLIARTKPKRREFTAETPPEGFSCEKYMQEASDCYTRGNLATALALYRTIIRYRPDDYKALMNATRIENIIASSKGERSADIAGPSRRAADALYLKGQFYYRIREYRSAIALWEEAYRVDPTYTKAYINAERAKKMQ